ncbi:MAG: ABC transporter permease [Gammaproteobacteria bacterium SG8_11]|nr:MAG: ABC transporter permease [Gammaproteobacteria bacterium SG8_11]
MKRFWAVLKARNLEFLRDRTALAWNFVMPVAFVFGFAFLFSSDEQDVYKIGVYPSSEAIVNHESSFFDMRYVKFIPIDHLPTAIDKVKHHQLDMVIDLNKPSRYWINSTSANGYFLEKLLLAESIKSEDIASIAQLLHVVDVPEKQTVSGREVRYVDWVLPGILAVNMMFSCLYGVGYVIVRYRKNRVLRRLKATPLLVFEFLAAQVVSRWLLTVVMAVIVFVVCDIFVNFFMRGSYVALLVVFATGSLTLISLGLVVAARIKSEELSDGVLNLISWPMMLLSGVWFSLEGVHPMAQKLSQVFPLTHMISAARAIMNDGAGLLDVYPQMLILVGMATVFFIIGSLSFRWE